MTLNMTQGAQERLRQYMDQLHTYLKGCEGVDPDQIERDVRDHIEHDLENETAPVSEEAIDQSLRRLGAPSQWVPQADQPAWRRVLHVLRHGPEDFRLAYLALALLLLGLLHPVFFLASFFVARAVLSFDPSADELRKKKWLIYPALIIVYAMILATLLLWPLGLVGAMYDNDTIGHYFRHRMVYHRFDPDDLFLAFMYLFGTAITGIWWIAVGCVMLAFPKIRRTLFRPFFITARFPMVIIAIGLFAALIGGIAATWICLSMAPRPATPSALISVAYTQPTTAPMTPAQAMAAIQSATERMEKLIESSDQLLDPKFRDSISAQIIPVLKDGVAAMHAMETAQPQTKSEMAGPLMSTNAMLSLFGDAQSQHDLQTQSASTGPDAIGAQCSLLFADWLRDRSDAALAKILDRTHALAQSHPTDDLVTSTIVILNQFPPHDPAQRDALEKIITDDLKTPESHQAALEIAVSQKLRQLEGKPIAITGTEPDGPPFTTAQWKGKVIVVDFWASWCGPCVAELPKIAKTYQDYHSKGLEILGVSNDYEPTQLKKFLSTHEEVSWPQLFDPASAAKHDFNSITTGLGIQSIPRVFLIDKKGNLRSSDAGDHLEELIPKMLDEAE